jgi:hypothetical protein
MLHRDGSGFDRGDGELQFGADIPGGGQWHVMDLHDNFMAFNGTSVCWQTAHVNATKLFFTDAVTIRTGGVYNDSQPFMGGFDATDIHALSDWLTYLTALDANADANTQAAIDALTGGAGQNWVWVGTVGGGDLLWFASLYLMKRGYVEQNRLRYFDGTKWTAGAGWAIAAKTYVHTPGNTATLSQSVANQDFPITVGVQYRVRFTVSGRTAGSVTASLGTANGTTRSTNATFEELITCSGTGVFAFTPTTDFDGTLSFPTVQPVVAEPFGDNYWLGEILPRNEAAFMPMPWPGAVQCMKQLGRNIMVYGVEDADGNHGGVTAMVPSDKHWGLWDIQGFPKGVGIVGRGAVGGDETMHVFLDDTGDMWRVTPDLQAERLEFKNLFSTSFGEHTVISYDPLEKEFYIAEGLDNNLLSRQCYVVNREGRVSRHWQAPCGLARTQGGLVGMLFAFTGSVADVTLTTHVLDAQAFGGTAHEMFTLRKVMVDTLDSNPSGWTCAVSYRLDTNDAFLTTSAVALDLRGHLNLAVPCLQCQITLAHADRTKTSGIGALHVQASMGARGRIAHLVANGPPGGVTV